MNTTQSWAGLPDHIKRQAAPDMLAGKDWCCYGCKIEHPGADELRRWAGITSALPQMPAIVAGNVTPASDRPEVRQRAHSARDTIPKPMTRQEKRQAVDIALRKNDNVSDRELSRLLGVSHTFIANRRRMLGNVAT